MSLTTIPNELILTIAKALPPSSLNHLILTSRGFYRLLTPLLHESAMLDRGELTALQYAAKNRYIPLIKLLLEKGVDINYHLPKKTYENAMRFGTALHWATYNGHEDVVELLLSSGADIDVTTEDYRLMRVSLLCLAVQRGHEGVVKVLLGKGEIDPHEQNMHLAMASEKGYDGIVRMLLEKGVDINACLPGFEGAALQHAVRNIQLTVVQLLLERGAKMEFQSYRREGITTSLEWAVRHNRWARSEKSSRLVKILQEGVTKREKAAMQETVVHREAVGPAL